MNARRRLAVALPAATVLAACAAVDRDGTKVADGVRLDPTYQVTLLATPSLQAATDHLGAKRNLAIASVQSHVGGARAWLREKLGPPRSEARARLLLVGHQSEVYRAWLARFDPDVGPPAEATWIARDGAVVTIETPDRLGATLTAWVFHVEWGAGLAPWVRHGLARAVAVARAGSPTAEQLLLRGTLHRTPRRCPDDLPDRSAGDPALEDDELAALFLAATSCGDLAAIKELLDRPPETVGAVRARAEAFARSLPTEAQLRRALERPDEPRSHGLLRAATPLARDPSLVVPDVLRDRPRLVALFAEALAHPAPRTRLVALQALFRLGERAPLGAALADPAPELRAAALVLRARLGERAVAGALLEHLKTATGALHLVDETAPLDLLRVFDALTGYPTPRSWWPARLYVSHGDVDARARWLGGRS